MKNHIAHTSHCMHRIDEERVHRTENPPWCALLIGSGVQMFWIHYFRAAHRYVVAKLGSGGMTSMIPCGTTENFSLNSKPVLANQVTSHFLSHVFGSRPRHSWGTSSSLARARSEIWVSQFSVIWVSSDCKFSAKNYTGAEDANGLFCKKLYRR